MKHMGLKIIKYFSAKIDYHPAKGLINWWENEMNGKNGKSRERRESKKECDNYVKMSK